MTSRAEAEQTLTRLARDGSDESRAKLVEALALVGQAPDALSTPSAQAAVGALLATLLSHADAARRAELTQVLAPAAWLPESVARDLTDAALASPESAALLAGLAANPGLGEGLLRRLAEAAERLPWVRVPLARHPRLTPALARLLHRGAGAALRLELQARFPGLPVEPREQTDGAVHRSGEALVRKLRAAGTLGPGRLLRFLREGRLDLFQAGAALLTGRPEAEIEAALSAPGEAGLARLCAEIGLDRALLPEVAARVRELSPAAEPAAHLACG